MRSCAWAGLVASAVLSACSLLQSYDGYGPGTPPTDAGSDVALADGSSSTDGGVTADATDGEAGPLGYCASNPGHTFCADFDDGSLTQWVVQGSGSVNVQPGLATSPSNAASITLGPTSTTDTSASMAHLLGTYTRVSLSFSANIQESANVNSALALISFSGASCHEDFAVKVAPNGTGPMISAYANSSPAFYGSSAASATPLPLGQWVRVTLEANTSGTSPVATLKVNGQMAVQHTFESRCKPYSAAAFGLALSFEQTNGSRWRVLYDDVLVDAQ